ncbi:MAG: 30S ribosomal protein S13 [uncultured bacterium]|nr:MAG: 30S ribosomal protein S13 [uncultured bacterium]
MARLMGLNIPDNKRIVISLTYIYGIGNSSAQKIIAQSGIDPNRRTNSLTNPELDKLREVIEKNLKVEGDLRMLVNQNVKRLKEINSYRGVRHLKKLPARGQRTKTNARTKRGKKVCVGSGRRDTSQKT